MNERRAKILYFSNGNAACSYFLQSFQDTFFTKHTTKKKTFTSLTNINGDEEESLRRAEEEEEEGEGRGDERGSGGYGAFKAWTEQVVDQVGVAS